jgi:hypothetical protein
MEQAYYSPAGLEQALTTPEPEAAMTATATMPETETNQAKEGRDKQGRFAKGNKGGPGNPFPRKIAMLRQTLVNFVTEEDMKHIAFVLKMKAESGDIQAMKLLFLYVIGKPTDVVDPDRLDVDEWEKIQECARPPEEMGEVMGRLPANVACAMTKIAWPCEVEQGFRAPMREGLKAMDELDAGRAKQTPSAGVKPAARPSTNRANGEEQEAKAPDWDDPAPIGNRPNGDEQEKRAWLQHLVTQAMAAGQENRPDARLPNGSNGGPDRHQTGLTAPGSIGPRRAATSEGDERL